MKYKIYLKVFLSTFFLGAMLSGAISQSEEFRINLSNPGQPGRLEVDIQNGNITVIGHDAQDVVITIVTPETGEDQEEEVRDGLKRIPNSTREIEITEENNEVDIEGGNQENNLEIRVPKIFSLSLSSHHNADIKVVDVVGEIEVDSHHGGIILENVGGSVIADTHHGEIIASFVSVEPNKPMAFSTYHGDVDVTFPPSIQCETKIKSSKGEIFTDFEISMNAPVVQRSNDGDRQEIKLGGWITGKIGAGGPEYMFNTYHGDVLIRKS